MSQSFDCCYPEVTSVFVPADLKRLKKKKRKEEKKNERKKLLQAMSNNKKARSKEDIGTNNSLNPLRGGNPYHTCLLRPEVLLNRLPI